MRFPRPPIWVGPIIAASVLASGLAAGEAKAAPVETSRIKTPIVICLDGASSVCNPPTALTVTFKRPLPLPQPVVWPGLPVA